MKLFFDFSFTTAILINVLILFLLFKSKNDEVHKKILFIIFTFILLTIICFYGYLHKSWILFYFTFIFEDSTAVLIGPLLLLYLKSIVLRSPKMLLKNWIHFVFPIIYILFIGIPLLVSLINKEPIFDYIDTGEDYFSLVIIYSLIYCFLSLRFLKKIESIIKKYYSNIEGVDLNWVKILLIGTIIVIVMDVSTTFYELFFYELTWNTFYITALGVVILIGYLGYNGLFQSKVLLPEFLLMDSSIVENSGIIAKVEQNIEITNDSEMILLDEKLEEIMNKTKPFLNEDLSLNSLALLLSTSDKKVSYLLNQHKNISFYDFVNHYRVEEVKLKLEDYHYDKFTLLAIAFECGFNSKSSFNRIFKKITQLSPSEYKKQIKIKDK